jgi:hypothetical protein
MSKCKGCGAEIIWARTLNKKPIPLDAEPTLDGNISLEKGIAAVVADNYLGPGQGPLYKSHFATCPKAKDFRK